MPLALLKKAIELASHVVVLDVRVKQKKKKRHAIHVESSCAKVGVRVHEFSRVSCNRIMVSIVNTLYYMQARAAGKV
jgi:hypothetical protein